jgi:hypothetical protein
MRRAARSLALVAALVLVTGCASAVKMAAGAALGGGPNVAANVQAGKTNAQVLGTSSQVTQKLVRPEARTIEQSAGETQVRTEYVETVVVHNAVPFWVWLAMILGWMLPTPAGVFRALARRFKKAP